MPRPFDFALLSRSKDTAKNSYQLQLEKIQAFSIDSGVAFNQILDMPYWLVDDYYKKGAWNIKKAHNEVNDQIQKNIMQMLININSSLRNIR